MARPIKEIEPSLQYTLPSGADESVYDPNEWFAERFPDATAMYGPAFLEGSWTDPAMQTHIVPSHMNSDVMAAILGGDPRLGHRVVFHEQEGKFYFYDLMVGAFTPTTEQKLELLLSNYLIRCAQACHRLVDVRPLMETFRTQKMLHSVITRAKALLQVDPSFFQGESGHRRCIAGKYIEPTDEPSYRQFVKKGLVARPDGKTTLQDAFHKYYRFCGDKNMEPLTRSEFRHLVTEVIREEFNIGFRHDVPGRSGKQTHGWFGVECVLGSDEPHGRN